MHRRSARPFVICIAALLSTSLAACSDATAPKDTGLGGNANWTIEAHSTISGSLTSVWARSASDIFAVVEYPGLIEHFDGKSWSTMDAPRGDLTSIWGVDATTVFAVGGNSHVLRYSGGKWAAADSNLTPNAALTGVWGSSAHDVFAVGAAVNGRSYPAVVAHFDGTAWHEMDLPGDIYGTLFNGVWGTSSTNVYAVGNRGVVLHYNGSSWSYDTRVPQGFTYLGVWGSGPSDVYIIGDSVSTPVILHYNGGDWAREQLPIVPGLTLLGIAGTGSSNVNVVAIGDDHQSYLLHCDGIAWTEAPSPAPERLHGIAAAGQTTFAVGDSALVLANSGTGWSTQNKPGVTFTDVWATSQDSVFVVASDGSLLESTASGGSSWKSFATPTSYASDSLRPTHLWSAPGTSLFAVSSVPTVFFTDHSHGGVYRFDGSRWVTATPSQVDGHPVRAIWGAAPNDLYIVADAANILHFDGSAWTSVYNPGSGSIADIWGLEPNDVYAVGPNGLLHYDGTAWTDTPWPFAINPTAIWGTSDSNLFVASGTQIFHYDGSHLVFMLSYTFGAVTAMDGSGPNDIYAVGDGFALHYNGTGWDPITLPVSEDWTRVRVVSPSSVYIVGSDRTILHGSVH